MRPTALELGLYGAAVLGLGSGFLATPSSPAFEPGARAAGTYRVVTWNVGGVDDGGPAGLADANVEVVARTLAELEPDLVVLQEVRDRAQLRRLADGLPGDWDTTISRDGTSRVAALGRGDLIRLDLDGAGGPRALGLLHASALGRDVYVVGLHADAFDADARNHEIGTAFDALRRLPRPLPRILAGDLNVDLDLDKRRDLFSNDAYRDVESYNYVASAFEDATRGTGSTAEPDRRLDYVFTSAELDVVAAGPWKGRRAAGMDHDPVVVHLKRAAGTER